MASDSFTGADNTALADHDANWGNADATWTVAGLKISSNQSVNTGVWVSAGARYTTSTNDTSQLTRKATAQFNGNYNEACAIVRANGTVAGYGFCIPSATTMAITKGAYGFLYQNAISACDPTVDHVLKLVASGTNPVILEAFLDGVSVGSTSDSDSPYTSGNPGFLLGGNGILTYVDDWDDGGAAPPVVLPYPWWLYQPHEVY